MGKMSVSMSDSLVKTVEAESEKLGRNKSEIVVQAVEFWFGKGRNLEEILLTTQKQLAEAQKNFSLKENELFQQSKKLHDLEKQIEEKVGIIESQEEKVRGLEERILTLQKELQEAQEIKKQFESTLQIRIDEIDFLRGHIAQLTQLAQQQLPPSQEEAKKKGWWQFWK